MTTQVTSPSDTTPLEVYQGQFGDFTITTGDRREVVIYRAGLMLCALSFAIGVGLVLWQGDQPFTLPTLTALYSLFSIGLGISLLNIHIYLRSLHRALQLFWAVGTTTAIALALLKAQPLALTVYQQPFTLLGIGFTFVALTGIFFKEAFCFNRVETKVLTALVPLVLLGHLTGLLNVSLQRNLLIGWAVLFLVFALRKVIQPIPPDIGDKSVFAYLERQRTSSQETTSSHEIPASQETL